MKLHVSFRKFNLTTLSENTMFHWFEFLFILPISFFLLFFFFFIKVGIFTSVCLDFYYYYIVIIAIALTRISFCFKKGFFLQSHSCQSFIVHYLQTCSSLVKKNSDRQTIELQTQAFLSSSNAAVYFVAPFGHYVWI